MVFFQRIKLTIDIELVNSPAPEGGVASKQVFLTLRQQAQKTKKA
jgi:5-methyltetrahydrofolate--homocysteine methyltransferase